MEAIKDFVFSNFELIGILSVLVLIVVVMFILFLFKFANISETKNQLFRAIMDNSLDDFLNICSFAIKGVFEQSYEIKKATEFLEKNLSLGNISKIVPVFNNLIEGGEKEIAVVFKRSFLRKEMTFWSSVYLSYIYPAEDQETAKILQRIFCFIYEDECLDFWKVVYSELLVANYLDQDSAELLKKEERRIYEMLKSERVSPALL